MSPAEKELKPQKMFSKWIALLLIPAERLRIKWMLGLCLYVLNNLKPNLDGTPGYHC